MIIDWKVLCVEEECVRFIYVLTTIVPIHDWLIHEAFAYYDFLTHVMTQLVTRRILHVDTYLTKL